MSVYETAVRPLLFRLDAERAHNLALRAAEVSGRSEVVRRAAARAFVYRDPRLETTLAGIPLANPLGLAAGFDKNGRAIAMLGALGFGHLEIGSISAHASDGNPKPRLFRIPQDHGIVVAYGVPNDGADVVRERLGGPRRVPLGVQPEQQRTHRGLVHAHGLHHAASQRPRTADRSASTTSICTSMRTTPTTSSTAAGGAPMEIDRVSLRLICIRR
jgi:hypothetical protein